MSNPTTYISPLVERLASPQPLRIALIGAMDQEIELLRTSLAQLNSFTQAGYDFHEGELHGAQVMLLKSGIGKVNAAIGTALLLSQFQPDCVINTGSAGGTDPSLQVGDLVISDEVLHHDADLTIFGYQPGQLPGMPATFSSDPLLSQVAEECIAQFSGMQMVHGLIATGDSFMNQPERVAHICQLFPDLKAVEMEAAAIAQTCFRFQTPCIVIRALSDVAGRESNISFKEFLETAATHSAQMVSAIVKDLVQRQATQSSL
ncbi:5'-methylthioadenosine/S-adenosylhomocysteine nucleosidase [Nitrincola tapanii]|uniref:5'-methylthioadenosine/S-adenosylhomocysteine nucleosidase n=1 Tax=Nitrincola tapanii TaxID=1708751 RepID=A0A5A9W4J5_9GAMM|nr:5'-methylthioadenosine/S-adenosylhomocysteine nucleosidase [Nitrincola tapanii]KAA0875443.1 5'-methylthioadenosine/S-adenosylhomocysteine nucleosidase [Nitrincola tapanii]